MLLFCDPSQSDRTCFDKKCAGIVHVSLLSMELRVDLEHRLIAKSGAEGISVFWFIVSADGSATSVGIRNIIVVMEAPVWAFRTSLSAHMITFY